MEKQTGERRAGNVGRAATPAAAAGLAGVAVAVALTASVLIGAVYGATSSSPVPSTDQPDVAALAGGEASAPSWRDDYFIRCQAVGWCAMPPGQPQPSRSATTE